MKLRNKNKLSTVSDSTHEEMYALLQRGIAGDKDTENEFWIEYQPELERAVRVRLRDPLLRRYAGTLDLCQTVRRRFFERQENYEFSSLQDFRKLIATILIHRIDALSRKARNELAREIEVASQRGFVNFDSTDYLLVRELEDKARKLVSEDDWALFRRVKIDGERYVDLEEELAISADAIRKRVDRIIAKLRKELGWEEG